MKPKRILIYGSIYLILLTLLILLITFTITHAADYDPEHSKINTFDISVNDPGQLSLGTLYQYSTTNHHWDTHGKTQVRSRFHQHVLGGSTNLGLMKDTDISIGSNYTIINDKGSDPEGGQDFGDIDVTGRYRFYKNDISNVEAGYILGIVIPAGSASDQNHLGTSQNYYSVNQVLVITKDWGKLTGNIDTGYSITINDQQQDSKGVVIADIAFGYQLNPWFQPEIELNYNHGYFTISDNTNFTAITLGCIFTVTDKLGISSGIQQGLFGRNVDKITTIYTYFDYTF